MGKIERIEVPAADQDRLENLVRDRNTPQKVVSNNAAEWAIRGIAVGRRNWTFAGSDVGGHRAALYTLVETCKLNEVDPRAWCLIPGFDGAFLSPEWRDALWAKFSMGAPQRQRQSVEQSKIVKRA
jgi:hypothetical protein